MAIDVSKSDVEFIDTEKKDQSSVKPFHWYENDLSLKIMEKKYLYPEEKTYEEFLNRVTKIFNKETSENLYALM